MHELHRGGGGGGEDNEHTIVSCIEIKKNHLYKIMTNEVKQKLFQLSNLYLLGLLKKGAHFFVCFFFPLHLIEQTLC